MKVVVMTIVIVSNLGSVYLKFYGYKKTARKKAHKNAPLKNIVIKNY
jgi:hypothetical protein